MLTYTHAQSQLIIEGQQLWVIITSDSVFQFTCSSVVIAFDSCIMLLCVCVCFVYVTVQLLDLMHTLHTRAASIYSSWAEEQRHLEAAGRKIEADSQTLWTSCWCPLLQGTA